MRLKVSAQVDGRRQVSTLRITHTKASGEPIAIGRKHGAQIAMACHAIGNDQPNPEQMAGNVVRLKLKVEEFNGFVSNKVADVDVPPQDEDGLRQPQGQTTAEQYRAAKDGYDPNDDLPF